MKHYYLIINWTFDITLLLPRWLARLTENELVADLRGHFQCAPVNFTIENQ